MKLTVEEIARICHEANRGYCQSIGDNSQVAWEDAPEWQRKTVIQGVHNVLTNPDTKPRDSHESWMRTKKEEGWAWGPTKDSIKKEHPLIVPYEKLSEADRAKDYIFLAVAKALLGV